MYCFSLRFRMTRSEERLSKKTFFEEKTLISTLIELVRDSNNSFTL